MSEFVRLRSDPKKINSWKSRGERAPVPLSYWRQWQYEQIKELYPDRIRYSKCMNTNGNNNRITNVIVES